MNEQSIPANEAEVVSPKDAEAKASGKISRKPGTAKRKPEAKPKAEAKPAKKAAAKPKAKAKPEAKPAKKAAAKPKAKPAKKAGAMSKAEKAAVRKELARKASGKKPVTKKAAAKPKAKPAKKAAPKGKAKRNEGGTKTNATLKGMSRPGTMGDFIKGKLLAGWKPERIEAAAAKKWPKAVSINAYIRVCRKQLRDNGKRV